MKILVTPTQMPTADDSEAAKMLRDFADEVVFNATGRTMNEGELIAGLEGCAGVIVGVDVISKAVISARRDTLKVISRYGVGIDNIDVKFARENGITVSRTPGANAESVADLAFGMMLCLARRLPMLDRTTKAGEWVRAIGTELFGKTIGIIGLGAIGRGVARRARGFSMRTLAYDVNFNREYASENGIEEETLEGIIEKSDYITLHVPLDPSTSYILDREALYRTKPGAVIINTARGGLIDEKAAYDLLVGGHLGGLGMDVFESEPPASSPLLGLENVVLTPHTGAYTVEATKRQYDMAVRNLIDIFCGRPCPNIVL